MTTVLVTGGAGYIGSHTIRELVRNGFDVVVYDNFSRGHRGAIEGFVLVSGSIMDTEKLSKVIWAYEVDAVMHFAAHSLVGESMQQPDLYYINNVIGSLKLLGAALQKQVPYFIFSSSAAVYGDPIVVPLKEDHSITPINPYGESKAIVEKALGYYNQAYGLKSISLRYFNAAGATPDGDIGEDHKPETHLIPLAIQAALGQKEKLTVFGNDYNTVDGTAIRDYIHVNDLATAHVLALQALLEGKESNVYNLGSHTGYSVLEIINAVEKVSGQNVPYEFGLRRDGDPAVLIASSEKAEQELGWRRRYTKLEDIIATAWQWHSANPQGFTFRRI